MQSDPHALKLYIDGSCFNNPGGQGGFAAWIEFPTEWNRPNERLEEQGFHETTNNRMELRACIWAHDWVRDHAKSMRVNRVQIVTDSEYVHRFWRLAEQWKRNGWRLSSGRPAENANLWKELLSVRSKLRVRADIEWTSGKSSEITKAVDKSAKKAAKAPTEIDRGFRSGKVGRTRNKVSGAAVLFPASGQEAIIRVYHTAAYSRAQGENRIKFQLFSESLGDFSDKFTAYASPETGGLLRRGRVYRVQVNSDPKYPVILAVLKEFMTADEFLKTVNTVDNTDSN
jgi:ribonuclease HI